VERFYAHRIHPDPSSSFMAIYATGVISPDVLSWNGLCPVQRRAERIASEWSQIRRGCDA
jgi:hypothetical protein